ncbi:hypothetical protein ACHAXR_002904 [Thalassiosira sp. AJA248-18]
MDHQRHYQQHPNEDIPPFFEPILQFYNSLPPISRTWFTLSLITTGLHTLEIFDTKQLLLLWDRIPPPHLELWRILTSFTWAGPGTMVDFPVLMLLYSLAVVVPGYEQDPHETCRIENVLQQEQEDAPNNSEDMRDRIVNRWIRRRPVHKQSDCLFAFLICSILILLSYLLFTETSVLLNILSYLPISHPILLPVFTRTLLYSIITLHSLKHPDQQQNINFFPVPGRYVPLFHVVFGLLMGYRINETIHGISIGFVYACLVQEDGWPAWVLGRKRLLCTPQWLIQLLGEDGIEGNIITGVVENVRANANIPYQGVTLEPGASFLHHAAAIGDVSFIQSQIDQVESVTSVADVVAASAPFHQQDRNGWQPLHEAARSGQFNVLKLLLEVDTVDQPAESRTWRRRAGKLRVNVNVRTNNDRGYTALRLVEENHGEDNECAELLRQVGGVSLGMGDVTEEEE